MADSKHPPANSSKTEVIQIGIPHQTQVFPITCITISGHNIPLSPTPTNLGVKFDSHLSFDTHIHHLTEVSIYHLKNIAKPLASLSEPDAFISSRLDYCKSLLVGLISRILQKWKHLLTHQCLQGNAPT